MPLLKVAPISTRIPNLIPLHEEIRSGTQEVKVNAESVNDTINVVGNFKLPSITGAAYHIIPVPSNLYGSVSEGSGVGAVVGVHSTENQVKANIESGVDLYANDLEVNANQFSIRYRNWHFRRESRRYGF